MSNGCSIVIDQDNRIAFASASVPTKATRSGTSRRGEDVCDSPSLCSRPEHPATRATPPETSHRSASRRLVDRVVSSEERRCIGKAETRGN